MKRPSQRPGYLEYQTLEPRALLAANLVLSEFVASNSSTLDDGYGEASDWIELHNAGDAPVNLQGYHLTDRASTPLKWIFPNSRILGPNEYLVVFASSRDSIDPAGNYHTNFALSAGGEYVGLYSPTGTLLSQFGTSTQNYPAQVTDISYGIPSTPLVEGSTPSAYLVPGSDAAALGTTWTVTAFNATANGFLAGMSALGYENNPGDPVNYTNEIRTAVPAGTTSTYLRSQFQLANAALVSSLNLELKYDDGFAVYLNGQFLFSRNAPNSPVWNSTATGDHPDAQAIQYENFSLTSYLTQYPNLLVNGTNTLAIHALNISSGSSDFLLSPRLTTNLASGPASYLATPTPGGPNSGLVVLGPTIDNITASGVVVNPQQNLRITALVGMFQQNPVNPSSVELHYRHGYGNELSLTMYDDGINGGDVTAGDRIYSATIPGTNMNAGQMLRWYVTARDVSSNLTRAPRFLNPTDSAEYFGTVVTDPSITWDMPLMQWFVENPAAAETQTGTRASLFYLGKFYDNVQVDVHGQGTLSLPKKSFDFDANSGQKFDLGAAFGTNSDFNLLTNYADQSKVRHPLAYEVFRGAGVPALMAHAVVVHRNGQFHGTYDLVEEGGEEYLERVGLDPNGSLYKVNNGLRTATGDTVTKETRKYEDNSDLQELVNGAAITGPAAITWDLDHLEIATIINSLAVHALIGATDFGHRNMYWYHDIEGNGLWHFLPWDQDLTFGHNWTGTYTDNTLYLDRTITPSHGAGEFNNRNLIFERIYADPVLGKMFFRRLRTLTDQFYGTTANVTDSYVWQRIQAQRLLQADESASDLAAWGLAPSFAAAYPFNPSQAIDQLQNIFIGGRRSFITADPRVPASQSLAAATSLIQFQPDDFDKGLLAGQYIRLTNPSTTQSIDISGWKLTGGIQHTFQGGTVIPAGGSLYVVKDVKGFQARTSGAGAGQNLFIQGSFAGDLSSATSVNLLANDDSLVDVLVVASPQVVSVVRDAGSTVRPDRLTTIAVTFNRDVTVPQNSLTLVNRSTGAPNSYPTQSGFTYDAATFTATWSFSNLPSPVVSAFYTIRLSGSLISASGEPLLGGDHLVPLYVALPGDANLDGDVDVSDYDFVLDREVGDLKVLLSNLNSPGLKTWAQGDFNGDGDVDVSDYDFINEIEEGDLKVLLANLGRNVVPSGSRRSPRLAPTGEGPRLRGGNYDAGRGPVSLKKSILPLPQLTESKTKLGLAGSIQTLVPIVSTERIKRLDELFATDLASEKSRDRNLSNPLLESPFIIHTSIKPLHSID